MSYYTLRIVTLLAVISAGSFPQADASDKTPDQIRTALEAAYPNLPKPIQIRTSPIAGLNEVYAGGQIFYVDDSAKHLIDGSIHRLDTKQNLTQDRLAVLGRIEWDKLPHDQAIKTRVNGDGSRKVMVFADPNCGYCKRLETAFTSVKNVTVYTVVLPVLGDDSVQKSRNILCAGDPAAAWINYMLKGISPLPAPSQCAAAQLAKTTQFAKTAGIFGTPAIFFEDGTKVPGAMTTEAIEQALNPKRGKPER